MDAYEIQYSEMGRNGEIDCIDNTFSNVRWVAVNNGFAHCSPALSLSKMHFNFKSMRFINVYPYGYYDDNKGNTPSVGGGTCAKIE
jgi:hypothetical protein